MQYWFYFECVHIQEYKGILKIVKIDHDANPQLIEEYKVYGLPCLILFKNGQQVPESRREGAITKVKLKEYIDSLLGSTSVVWLIYLWTSGFVNVDDLVTVIW